MHLIFIAGLSLFTPSAALTEDMLNCMSKESMQCWDKQSYHTDDQRNGQSIADFCRDYVMSKCDPDDQ